ncbi:MAG: LysR substrate-binding domain-containing protein [Beijerinckiaceae bacterium]
MMRRLPPFGPLVAFDAVVRHRSFTRAADELGVTQSAISHQVRRLENFFGLKLLKRLNPGVEPTENGSKLLVDLAILLDGMAGLEPGLRQRSGKQTLRLGVGSSLATWWLVRRLRSFHALHPDIEIDLVPTEIGAKNDPSLDVSIEWTTLAESRATSLQTPLFREHVFPVCSPLLLPDGKPLSDPTALLDLPLIQKGHSATGEWSWSFWFRKLGLTRAEPRGLVLGNMGLCLTAAAEGGGVAIARSLLVSDAISERRLMPALAGTPDVLSTKVHVARWSAKRTGDRDTEVLVSWLTQAATETTLGLLEKSTVQGSAD